MTIPSGPKGTRDFYPDLMAQQEFLFSSWKKTCRRYGFEPYEGPMFEHLDLFKQKSGDEIEGQLYVFTDKKGRELALRPEMTPTLARMVAAAGSNLKWPVRWYSIPRLFRYEKMQKGRLREFFQLNMDILGVAGVSADAELIAAAIDMMRDLGLNANDFKVRISSRTLVDDLFSEAGLSGAQRNAVFVHLDKKSKIPPPVFEEGLAAIVTDTAMRGNIQRMLAARSLDQLAIQGPEPASLTSLRQLFALLTAYGLDDYAVFDIGVVRGLAYYTGIVFELFDAAGSMRAIAGGGRYDRLVELYDGPATPAVGFAAGDVVLTELLKAKNIVTPQGARCDCFIITFAADRPGEVIALARELRAEGISCEFALKQANPGKQMKIANAARATYALFTGGEESDAGMIKVKNMGSGEEHLIPRSSIASEMHKLKVEGR
jgi:histidyl-tRNA synthetase